MPETRLFVERGSATASEVRETVEDIINELRSGDSEGAAAVRELGADPGQLQVEIDETGQGFDPVSTILIAIGSGFGKEIAKRIWSEVIRPEIRRRRGADAIGEVKDSDEEQD